MMTTVDVSMPKLIGALTLRVRFGRLAGARLRVAAAIMQLAGRVAGTAAVQVEVESEEDRRERDAFRAHLQRHYDRAERALMGGRWTREDADRLVELINQGAATVPPGVTR